MHAWTTVAILVLVGALSAGCGSSDGTTAGAGAPATASTVPTSLTLPEGMAPMSDRDYGMAMLEHANLIGRVGGDLCGLDTSRVGVNMAEPSTSEQVYWSVYVMHLWMQGLQQALPAHGDAISAAYEKIRSSSARDDFPVGYWHSDAALEALAEPGYVQAVAELDSFAAVNCTENHVVVVPG